MKRRVHQILSKKTLVLASVAVFVAVLLLYALMPRPLILDRFNISMPASTLLGMTTAQYSSPNPPHDSYRSYIFSVPGSDVGLTAFANAEMGVIIQFDMSDSYQDELLRPIPITNYPGTVHIGNHYYLYEPRDPIVDCDNCSYDHAKAVAIKNSIRTSLKHAHTTRFWEF